MEPCNNKYSNSWHLDLYIYTNRSLCCADNNGCYDHYAEIGKLQSKRTTLPELDSTCTSCNIKQWICWNMEPCNNKYSNSWNLDLYIYTNRSLCCANNNGCYYHYAGNTNLHADRTTLPELDSTCTACNI